jgi:glycosyltransferase involved in cell wall biosynthesis
MNYKRAILKRNIELAGMFPFVVLGKLAGKLFKLKTQHRIFLFFPWAEIGGSIMVNVDIANCIKDAKPIIIFSKKPKNNGFRKFFDIENVRVIDLHKYIDNKLYHFVNFFFRGVLASWINGAKDPIVFGGESLYFYKVIPHLKKGTRCIELSHLNTWMDFNQAYVEYIDARIFSTPQVKRDIENQYKINGVPAAYFERLFFVDNKVDIPPFSQVNNSRLEVIFVGRGAPQKRVHLIAAIAKKMHELKSNIHFSFVGDVEKIVSEDVKEYTTLYGNVDKVKLNKIYDESDVLLLTSAFEGLPIVVMDMMARGRVVVSTAVGGIPDYIQHGETGFLINETDEDQIVSKAIEYLTNLVENKSLRTKIQQNAYQFAKEHFGEEQFCSNFRKFILSPFPV